MLSTISTNQINFKVRYVYDLVASYVNISLNSVMLRGPDLINNLVGVLVGVQK